MSCAFRALSRIPCTPNIHCSWWRYKRQAYILCRDLLSFLLIMPPVWALLCFPSEVQLLFLSSAPSFLSLTSSPFPLPSPLFFGWHLRCCMCYYHGHICFLNTVGTNICFSNNLYTAIQDAEKLSFHPLTTLRKKITASMFVVHVIYYSFSDSFISILIKNRLSKVN